EIGHNSSCPVCECKIEDTLHVLRDCKATEEVWLHVIPIDKQSHFFSGSLQDWLTSNFGYHVQLSDRGMALDTIKASFSWVHQFDFSHRDNHQSPQMSASSAPMANMWVNLFIDGVVASGDGSASGGGVLHDQNGNWILGFSHYLGRCSIFEAELRGIFYSLLVMLSK
ncbi:hypothetical protein Golax_007707, partial [Gossypium laxum]|nr:hypothetical protein [Gossypium laxum]